MGSRDLDDQPADERGMNRIRPLRGLLQRRRQDVRRRVGHSSATFARAVQARYRRSPAFWGGGDRVFLQQSGIAATTVNHHRWFLSRRAPRFLLRLGFRVTPAIPVLAEAKGESAPSLPEQPVGPVRAFAAAVPPERRFLPLTARTKPGRVDAVPAAPGVPAERARTLVMTPGTAPRHVALLSLVRGRLTRREPTATESVEIARPSQRLRRLEDPSLATVRAAVRRAPSPTAVAASRRQQDDWPPAPRPSWTRSAGGPDLGMAPPPQIDLQAVTSQVMRQIDRRLIAWRERTGRA